MALFAFISGRIRAAVAGVLCIGALNLVLALATPARGPAPAAAVLARLTL